MHSGALLEKLVATAERSSLMECDDAELIQGFGTVKLANVEKYRVDVAQAVEAYER